MKKQIESIPLSDVRWWVNGIYTKCTLAFFPALLPWSSGKAWSAMLPRLLALGLGIIVMCCSMSQSSVPSGFKPLKASGSVKKSEKSEKKQSQPVEVYVWNTASYQSDRTIVSIC